MNREDIIRMAREASLIEMDHDCIEGVPLTKLLELIALVAEHERDAIMDEWWMCVQSDLENGVKFLNERATEKWRKEYPEMARFVDVIRGREKE